MIPAGRGLCALSSVSYDAGMARARPDPVEPVTYGSPRFHSVETGGFLVTDAFFPAGSALPPHVHDRACVAVPLEGAFDSIMRRRSHWSAPGTMITEPPGEVHANRFGPTGTRVVVVQPDARRGELLAPCTGLLDSINHLADPEVSRLARRLVLELSLRHTAAELAVEALALEMLVVAARAHLPDDGPRAPVWLTRVRDRLHDDFRHAPDLQTLAAGAGVHPAHLTRTFRRHFGRSIGGYLRQVRLDWAAQRLATSDDLLVDVAAQAGFADQSHFTRLFRQQIGCTPARYRHRARAGRPE